MTRTLPSIILLAVAVFIRAGVVSAEEVWSDSFATTNSFDMNADIAIRSSGSANVQYDTKAVGGVQNGNWSIFSEQLSFDGNGSDSANLHLVNRGNGAYQNLYSALGGKKYQISLTVSVSSTSGEATDSFGIALSDNALGAPRLFIGQIRSRAQLDVDEAGTRVLRADDWANDSSYSVRLVVDETRTTPTYDVFVDDVLKHSGSVSFGDEQRHIYFLLKDTSGDMSALANDFRIETIAVSK